MGLPVPLYLQNAVGKKDMFFVVGDFLGAETLYWLMVGG